MFDYASDDFSKTARSRPLGDVLHIFFLLLINKLLKTLALFLTYDLLKSYHLILILFLASALASICLICIQKPFSSFRPKRVILLRLIRYSIALTVVRLLWLFGLTLCGPLRTILLFEHSDLVILTGLHVFFPSLSDEQQQSRRTSRVRGVVFFALAVLAIFAFDNDDARQKVLDHPEGQVRHRLFAHAFYQFTSLIGVADHKGGVILLLVALFMRCAINSSNKKLALDVGGPKKFYALTTCVSTLCLIPVSLFMMLVNNLFLDSTDVERTAAHTTLSTSTASSVFSGGVSLIIPLMIITVLMFVADFYVEQVATIKLDRLRTVRYSTWGMIGSALIVSLLWTQPKTMITDGSVRLIDKVRDIELGEHALSGGVVFAVLMFTFATDLLLTAAQQRSGIFIGYGHDGMPLLSVPPQRSQPWFFFLCSSLPDILAATDSRRIFYFLCINLMFTFVELLYGAWTNSLGLISDGFHMLFDCAALVVGLYAAVMSRWKSTRVFSYGYGRAEVLSGFVNGLFLVVVAFFVFYEAVGRLIDPPEINTSRLLLVSVTGFAVNMIGIFSFSHAHGHAHAGGSCAMSQRGAANEQHNHEHAHSHGTATHDHGHNHELSHSLANNANMKGVFLHVLADTLGSVGVIISSLLIQYFGWYISDPICSLFISIMIFLSVLPLLKDSAMTLLLQTPPNVQYDILARILRLDHVLSYSDEHFWRLTSSTIVGSIHIQVADEGDEQRVTAEVQTIFKDTGIQSVTIQVEKQTFFNHLSSSQSPLGQLDASKRTLTYR